MISNIRIQNKIFLFLTLMVVLASCKKWNDYHRYTDEGEKIYPGLPNLPQAAPGANRVMLWWLHSVDTRVALYRITWNNGLDSAIVDAKAFTGGDTVQQYINNLNESSYSFSLNSRDADGNISTTVTIPRLNVYGDRYVASLFNRTVTSSSYNKAEGRITIEWAVPDTINVGTEIKYTDNNDEAQIKWLHPDSSKIWINNWKSGTPVVYQSSYKPVRKAIDTFNVAVYDSLDIRQFLAGDYKTTGTLDREGTGITPIDETKPVFYQGNGVFKFQIAPATFNNNTLQVYMSVNADNTVNILPQSGSEASVQVIADGACVFHPETNSFALKYKYLNATGLYRKVEETLVKQ